MLQSSETGQLIFNLRKKIQEINYELKELGDLEPEIPELITSTNVLRANEYLSKANQKKTELLSLYVQYSESLETLLDSVFEIQNDLKEILKEQSTLIESQPKKKINKTKKSYINKK